MGVLNRSRSKNETNALKLPGVKNPERVRIGQVNINSPRNKNELLREVFRDKVDVLMISKTKLDFSFPKAKFYMQSYSKPYRSDRSGKGGGIILHVRE